MKSALVRAWAAALGLALGLAGCGESVDPGDDAGVDGAVAEDAAASDASVADAATDAAAPGCGDGVRQRPDEVCDDGNTDDGDGCSADCTSDESCGNEIIDRAAGELCDDGNADDGDGCRGDCGSDYQCGNGVLDTVGDGAPEDEVCDDGNTVNADGCSAACDSDESCGNGVVDLGAGEVCDDGNTEGGDDCSADCRTSLLCGNGDLDGAEECDDGNVEPADGCNASCQIERCGNGRTDADEDCDDGNTDDDDGCTTACAFTCSADADCSDTDVCNGDETCSGPGTDASACVAATAPASDGEACGSGLICRSGGCVTSSCNDGFVDVGAGEACDDMNTTSGDGCENDCSFTCEGDADCADTNVCNGAETCTAPGTLASRCAAGTAASDGASCGAGLVCSGGACTTAGCGDGFLTGAEQCDDGNTADADGCDADCTWTCAGAADCSDGEICTGTETCTMPGTLLSRCGAGTAPSDGASCGSGLICVGESCVARRCGDSIVTAPEQCDDGNPTGGDGCDNDCTWTCTGAADCADTNLCNGAETCTMPSTSGSRCLSGTAPPEGTSCDRDGMPGTRDVCRASVCRASTCGDGFVDAGATPSEQCDDGNTGNGDGCSSTCQTESAIPPTGFRVTNLDLISPRVVVSAPFVGCNDVTQNALFGFSVNGELDTAIQPMSAGGDYSLHIVDVFRPLDMAAATTPMDLHFDAACMEAPTPDACAPDAMPDPVITTANNQSAGTCFTPVAADVNTRAGTPAAYSPTARTVSGPCFVSSPTTITVSLAGIDIPLQQARVSATYSGTPTNRLVSGVVTGFLSETAAADVILPDTLPLVGGDALYEHLQAGNRTVMNSAGSSVSDSCNVSGGASEDDADSLPDGTRGFWFFLNFTADLVTWTDP